jgi:hypothetical protein
LDKIIIKYFNDHVSATKVKQCREKREDIPKLYVGLFRLWPIPQIIYVGKLRLFSDKFERIRKGTVAA